MSADLDGIFCAGKLPVWCKIVTRNHSVRNELAFGEVCMESQSTFTKLRLTISIMENFSAKLSRKA